MKSKLTSISILVVGLCYLVISLLFFSNEKEIKVTSWDALGYYMYLPATIIYHDVAGLAFYTEIEKKYHLQGKENEFYQFSKLENGNFAGKYFVGVSVMQLPFFLVVHLYSLNSSIYLADGFSLPYQLGIIAAAFFYLFIGLFFLRFCLRTFYSDKVSAITIILIGLATNLIQYSSVNVGQSHVYLFFLYCLILFLTVRWHKNYLKHYAFYIGLCIGLTTICRPTELIILFIPLLWLVNDKAKWKHKINILFKKEKQILFTTIGFFLMVFCQLIYWKYTTGSFIHNVGSKWHFFNPHFRVLFGFEKGWFIYTPITIFFIAGLFFLKNKSFKTALLTFIILNVWIVIAWSDWRYGGSYSTRALVQSYPIFALALAAFIQWVNTKRIRIVFYSIAMYLIALNLFQIYQYNTGILHYDKMNYEYYKRIYWNPNVTDEDKKFISE